MACRRLSSIMVGRLGTMDISDLLLRPGSETSLPPIYKVKVIILSTCTFCFRLSSPPPPQQLFPNLFLLASVLCRIPQCTHSFEPILFFFIFLSHLRFLRFIFNSVNSKYSCFSYFFNVYLASNKKNAYQFSLIN